MNIKNLFMCKCKIFSIPNKIEKIDKDLQEVGNKIEKIDKDVEEIKNYMSKLEKKTIEQIVVLENALKNVIQDDYITIK